MEKHFAYLLFLAITINLSGCKDDPVTEVVFPSNLVISVEESTSSEGLVSVSATAANCNFFSIIFFTETDSTLFESSDGSETYQYTADGQYEVKVKAHSSFSEFIKASENITIELSPIFNPNDTSGYSTPLSYAGYTLSWQDEFNGSTLNLTDWNFETGAGGWGNNELQNYLEANTSVDGGFLTIEAKDQVFNTSAYTSSRITTQGKQSFEYGRVDIRAKLPYGQGIWPALWMLGDNISSVGWPRCGEIDIMEMVGGADAGNGGGDNVLHGTIHWDNNGTKSDYGNSTTLSSGVFANKFHVFSIIWDNQKIEWYLDDVKYNSADITPSDLEEFHAKFFFIFNVAVGGNWPGSPDASTVFPQKMIVDYVRVFQ